mmetsp:Transcript_3620/g.9227  ORF Transcript_3620/g.9227 Transcript_3620/m.9227 type:complete len:243 (-) Transcript_3620:194-922(-)
MDVGRRARPDEGGGHRRTQKIRRGVSVGHVRGREQVSGEEARAAGERRGFEFEIERRRRGTGRWQSIRKQAALRTSAAHHGGSERAARHPGRFRRLRQRLLPARAPNSSSASTSAAAATIRAVSLHRRGRGSDRRHGREASIRRSGAAIRWSSRTALRPAAPTAAKFPRGGLPRRLHPQGDLPRLLCAHTLPRGRHRRVGGARPHRSPGAAGRHGHGRAGIRDTGGDTHAGYRRVARAVLGG